MSINVIKGRFKYKANLGDADNDNLSRRIRAHGNFAEYAPFALFLIFLTEDQGASPYWVHGLCVALIVGRSMHPFGILFTTGISLLRSGGMLITFCVILIASIMNILFFL